MQNQVTDETGADCETSFADQIIASQPMLRAFARSLCRQRELADDLVQEAMLRAWSSRHTFQPGSNLRAWLFTILRNQFYTAIRKRNVSIR